MAACKVNSAMFRMLVMREVGGRRARTLVEWCCGGFRWLGQLLVVDALCVHCAENVMENQERVPCPIASCVQCVVHCTRQAVSH